MFIVSFIEYIKLGHSTRCTNFYTEWSKDYITRYTLYITIILTNQRLYNKITSLLKYTSKRLGPSKRLKIDA